MNRIPLRARLTMVMTLIFGLTLTGAAMAGLAGLGHALRADTEANASAVLSGYLDELAAGIITRGFDSPEDGTRFVYLDETGKELTPEQYEALLRDALPDNALGPSLTPSPVPTPTPGPGDFPSPPIELFSGSGELRISADGTPQTISGDEGALVVGAPVVVGDTPLTIGVSSPLQPVTDSTDALARVLLIVVPVLTAAIAGVTWLIVGRALHPVDAITAQVEEISTENLDRRVPESEADDEIGRLAITMNGMLARLEQARDRQRQFISDASHELNSPITATQATLEVAQRHPDTTDWEATARTLQEENAIMASLAQDLLTLARLEEETQADSLQDIDMEELCSSEAQRQESGLVRVHVQAPGRVRGNPDHLTRAIRNVLDNAVRYADQRVDVTITQDTEDVVVTISDDGPGIPAEDQQRIFERFSQLDQSRTRAAGRGAGLGLAITQQIITSHHGTIQAGDRPGGGAVFTITLPAGPQEQ